MNSSASAKRVFTVKVRLEFAAAHHIRGYDGECARPHGHNFKVEVEAKSQGLNEIGIALDFKDLKRTVKNLIDRYDHQDLNTVAPFNDINPTAETLSQYFFQQLEKDLAAQPATASLTLKTVTIWENDRSAAAFGLE